MRPRDYLELDKLLKALAKKRGENPATLFDCASVGLVLRNESGPGTFEKSPRNGDCFATSGGEGVHFSLLMVPARPPEKWPVVMTVPRAVERPNVIVGAEFREFLALGAKSGFTVLGRLAHDEKAGLNAILKGLTKSEDTRPELRAAIVDRFGLKPWTHVGERLKALDTEFSRYLVLR